jgi:hypothetical protein
VIEDEKNDYVIVSNKASTAASKISNARNNDYPFLHSTKQNKSEI